MLRLNTTRTVRVLSVSIIAHPGEAPERDGVAGTECWDRYDLEARLELPEGTNSLGQKGALCRSTEVKVVTGWSRKRREEIHVLL